jgi:hypothetical protein
MTERGGEYNCPQVLRWGLVSVSINTSSAVEYSNDAMGMD